MANHRLNPVRALERIRADQTLLQSPDRMLELLRELDRDAYEAGLEHGRNEAKHEAAEPAHLDYDCPDCGASHGAGDHACGAPVENPDPPKMQVIDLFEALKAALQKAAKESE